MSNTKRKYELYTPEAKANIHATFAQMRDENPLFCQPGIDGQTMIWFASRYEDVETVLRDDRHFVRDPRNALGDAAPQPNPLEALISNHMLNKDWEDRRRLRNLVSQAFTPKIVRALRPRIQEIADELIDAVEAKGQMDLMADFAFHLPTIVIAELLGIPVADRDKFKVWSNAVIVPSLDADSATEFMRLMQEFIAYLQALFAARRQHPDDDLTSALLAAEEDGDRLNEQELFSMMVLLIVAGHETTVSLIGNAIVSLWQHPEQLALLQKNPSLMETAVEEFLRYDGPVERAFVRFVAEEVQLGAQHLPKGSLVIPLIASANRDETRFANADLLDITRQPNPHMGFGKGAHYCLGAPLARLEAEIALNTLLHRLPSMQPALPLNELRWRMSPMFRSLEALPVTWQSGEALQPFS